MTLRRRLATQIALTALGILMLGAAAIVGVVGLHQDFTFSLDANDQLRQAYTIGSHVAVAKSALEQTPPAPERALAEMQTALALSDMAFPADSAAMPLRSALRQATDQIRIDPSADASVLAPAYEQLADLSAATRRNIANRQITADQRHRVTLWSVSSLALATTLLAVVIGLRQYRSIMRPLQLMQQTVRHIAAGRFEQRLAPGGDGEFASLAADFNRMAEQLQTVYNDLELRVDSKSRQLVQSERLASVGYLAAGVAHEINNPLGIIAGYGERSLQRLDHPADPQSAAALRKAIEIICDEAFRCKQITDRLLMLARSGDSAHHPVSLAQLARDVATSLAGLPRFAGHRLSVQAETTSDLLVLGCEGELRQVLVNLAVNALEAVAPENGSVQVSIRRDGDEIELAIADNGCGMTAATLARVFEPFFSERRGTGEADGAEPRRGTGLGLSVAHAIVASHRGRIWAHSDGPGAGSRFVLRLPAATKEEFIHARRR